MTPLFIMIIAQVATAPQVGLEAEAGESLPKVLVLDLINSTELDAGQLEALQDAILGGLSGAPVQVMGAADIARLLEVQQGNVALGCLRDDCLFDLAKAWQARYVISGSLAMVAERAILNLKLLDAGAEQPRVLHRESHEAEPKALTALIRVTAAKMRQALGGPAPTAKEMEVLKVARLPVLGMSLSLISVVLVAAGTASHLGAVNSSKDAVGLAHDPLAVGFHLTNLEGSLSQRNLLLGLALTGGMGATYAWMKKW